MISKLLYVAAGVTAACAVGGAVAGDPAAAFGGGLVCIAFGFAGSWVRENGG